MRDLLNPEIVRKVDTYLYRSRFLLFYILIGVSSIAFELLCANGFARMGLPVLVSKYVGLTIGIAYAYWMNVRFNFKIPTAKRNRALLYFCVISSGSAVVNFTFNARLEQYGWSYGWSRFAVAGVFFSIAYFFHRRYTFVDFKKVGVAIYANGVEDIKGIYEKIGAFPDFIHVDIIDNTFGEPQDNPRAYRLEVIRAYWPRRPVHLHIMSRRPIQWINETAEFADTIIIHTDIDDDVNAALALIRAKNRRAGLCLTMKTSLESVLLYLGHIDEIMLLTIESPGKSGQPFDMTALDKITEINRLEQRRRLTLCVDGGVNERNIGLLNVESVVSGSAVLNHQMPVRQIMRLQTSSNYEVV